MFRLLAFVSIGHFDGEIKAWQRTQKLMRSGAFLKSGANGDRFKVDNGSAIVKSRADGVRK